MKVGQLPNSTWSNSNGTLTGMTQPSEQHLKDMFLDILRMLGPFWVLPSKGAGVSIKIIINCSDSSSMIRPQSQSGLCKPSNRGRLDT